MRTLFPTDRLVIATHNKGKLREFADLLTPYVKHIVSAEELKLGEPEETGKSFTENAILKARAASIASGFLALADDSGLCVTALAGDPGIYSARWGGADKNFSAAMKRVNDALGNGHDRSAYFICVLALAWSNGYVETFEGRIDGSIIWPPRGHNGHGYDPFFVPASETRTFAEMPNDEKNSISHRAVATHKLIAYLQKT